MNGAIVAINIFDNNTLINKDNVPILFYWERTNDIISSLKENDEFCIYISNHIKHYDNSYITLIYFELDDNNSETDEKYLEYKNLNIQNLFTLDKFSDEFVFNLIIKYFYELYKLSYKSDYSALENSTKCDTIVDIYKQLKSKYKQKLNIETVINYVHSKLNEETKLNNENIKFIIKTLEKTLDYANI